MTQQCFGLLEAFFYYKLQYEPVSGCGSICSFYPKLTVDSIAILTSEGLLVDPEYAVGSIWSEWFTISLTPSGGLQKHAVTLFTMLADLNVIEDQCFLVKHYSFTSPVTVSALLYATVATSPHKVPVGLQEGKERLRSSNDLELNFWVNTLACDKFAMPANRYCRTFSAIPDAPALKLTNLYTIVHEDPKGYPPPNALLKECFGQSLLNDMLKENVLILKHVYHNHQQLADVTDNNISIINLLLDEGALRKTFWAHFK
ncbi:hypothetical protein EDD22DRAFT_844148 [Suillus occidentalis]|nr:hypothetical protein EDD22DRAFT_844148 [Suillus occidentalis]